VEIAFVFPVVLFGFMAPIAGIVAGIYLAAALQRRS
jgi:hypothetical protein